MTKIDIFSGFLGAGKTTLIKKLIAEAYNGEKLVLIENEFGDVGIDGGFLQDAGIEITEMNSGCICCSLVGDFGKALTQVLQQYAPDRIIIEPSGVGKLSDVMNAVAKIEREDVKINGLTTIVDAKKCKMYSKNFGEFFNNQIGSAKVVILSHTAGLSDEKLAQTVELIKNTNSSASVITTDWDKLKGKDILEVIEGSSAIEDDIKQMISEQSCPVCGHHHDHDEECEHHHHHDHDEECEHHHHHDHDEECEHHHHHDHDEECEHHHHHDHDEECEHHH
ncbi:MAG: GTP-binding protein, partial [Acutalibacteraceae bacterium]